MERRLAKLEIVYQRRPKSRPSRERSEWAYLCTPALFWALSDAADDRARRRLLVPGRPAQVAWEAWAQLNAAEQEERKRSELEALDMLIADLGVEFGLQTWVEETVAIGAMFDGETGERCWRMYQYTFALRRNSLDRTRAKHPNWAAAHPDWSPDMPASDFLLFEMRLLERVRDVWQEAEGA
jgi:hypothetical protein